MKTRLKIIKCGGNIENVELEVNKWLEAQEDISIHNFWILPLLVPPGSNNMVIYISILYTKEDWR